jgi:sporulation protein YlmC with PRC-barrel domain
MLRSLNNLEHYKVSATDGNIGNVVNFLLDDERWTIRYLVVKPGGFFNQHQMLISPIFFREVDWSAARIHLALTMDKIKNSPSVDVHKPVSRQHERDYYGYYGYPYYWGSSGIWGMGAYPGALTAGALYDPSAEYYLEPGDVHLRSAQEVRGYHIEGSDGSIGHVEDFIVDDETWAIRYLVVDTSNWWVSKKVLIAPAWATSVSWEKQCVNVALSRQAIKDSPEWNAYAAVNREYELRLYDYYGRPVYWDSSNRAVGARPPQHSASHPV